MKLLINVFKIWDEFFNYFSGFITRIGIMSFFYVWFGYEGVVMPLFISIILKTYVGYYILRENFKLIFKYTMKIKGEK